MPKKWTDKRQRSQENKRDVAHRREDQVQKPIGVLKHKLDGLVVVYRHAFGVENVPLRWIAVLAHMAFLVMTTVLKSVPALLREQPLVQLGVIVRFGPAIVRGARVYGEFRIAAR